MRSKFVIMSLLIAIATLIADVYQDRFDIFFGDMLSVLIYILVPSSAINLTDYYFVRKGHYVIADLDRIDGIYGPLPWRGSAVYAFGIGVRIPFIQLSFYTGDIARYLGADMAWVAGLINPAVVYSTVERSISDGRELRTG